MDVPDEATADKIIAAVSAEPFQIASVKRGEKQRSPSPPFITSTLQQEASRRLGMTPRRTMSVAQQLYEGVDITDRGTIGLITSLFLVMHGCLDDVYGAGGIVLCISLLTGIICTVVGFLKYKTKEA